MPRTLTALCLLFSCGLTAAATPLRPSELLDWPRQNLADFACQLEQRTGQVDATFSCARSKQLSDWGDACHPTDLSDAGPQLPAALARQLDPRISEVQLEWEYGRLQSVSVTFARIVTPAQVKAIFPGLNLDSANQRPNLSSASLQECATNQSCLYLEGFEHMGGADVECDDAE
ncbi:MAG: hypothetical protein GAK43_01003 [Stenotrophomonas maltophilia]|nr:MAG: hypothetical protein GAK43_01003 [Stenotrophomonas maltophilia]